MNTAQPTSPKAEPVRIQDAGGVPLADGGWMQERLAFRISGLIITPEQLEGLRTAGVKAVVDLRGTLEDRAVLIDWAAASGIRYHHEPVPVADPREMVELSRTAPAEEMLGMFEAFYVRIVDDYAQQIVATLRVIAEGDVTCFGCAAGRDRTGIVGALLQSLLGATDDTVLAAYASAAPDPELMRLKMGTWLDLEPGADLPEGTEVFFSPQPSAIVAVLARVRETHGSVRGYLVANGLEDQAVSAIREFLIRGTQPDVERFLS